MINNRRIQDFIAAVINRLAYTSLKDIMESSPEHGIAFHLIQDDITYNARHRGIMRSDPVEFRMDSSWGQTMPTSLERIFNRVHKLSPTDILSVSFQERKSGAISMIIDVINSSTHVRTHFGSIKMLESRDKRKEQSHHTRLERIRI